MNKIIFAIILTFLLSCSSDEKKETKIFPIYGNYCGLGNPRAFSKLDPISVTDFLCEERIDCYKRNGSDKYQACDKLFASELIKVSPKTSEENAARQAIIFYFKK